jgi:hypothetical protein
MMKPTNTMHTTRNPYRYLQIQVIYPAWTGVGPVTPTATPTTTTRMSAPKEKGFVPSVGPKVTKLSIARDLPRLKEGDLTHSNPEEP